MLSIVRNCFSKAGIREYFPSILPIPSSGSVSQAQFRAHLSWLARLGYQTLSLADYAQRLRHREPPLGKYVAITFDDGYVDNLFNAKPRLETADVPATVFLATGYLAEKFWWDELAQMIISWPTKRLQLDGTRLSVPPAQIRDQLWREARKTTNPRLPRCLGRSPSSPDQKVSPQRSPENEDAPGSEPDAPGTGVQ